MLNFSTTATLFAANVGNGKGCYQTFRDLYWKKTRSQEIYCSKRSYIAELVDVIKFLIVLKREMYTIRQLRELYANIVRKVMK